MCCPVSVSIARDECISFISDLTKEIYGCRPRYNWSEISLETLAVMVDEVISAHEYHVEDSYNDFCFEEFDAKAQAEADEWAAVCPDEFDELCELRGW
jgi:hypothetical protein